MADLFSKIVAAGRNLSAINGAPIGKLVAAFTGVDLTQIEGAINSLNQPSLCYIPIQSEAITMKRTADIGTTMLIAQTNQAKEYVTDNSAPRPRVWTGNGYITPLVPILENGLVIKPSIQVQQAILEAAADSRQPVKFKTDNGEVVDVLIQDLQITSTPKSSNVRVISYTVQEVKILENSILLDDAVGFLDNIGMNSIPVRAITNLGKNGSIMSGRALNGVANILSIAL